MSSSTSSRSRFLNFPLGWVLIVPFVVQVVGSVALVAYFSYQSGQKAITHLSEHLIDEVDDRVHQHLRRYLGNTQRVNQMNLDAVQAGVLDPSNFKAVGNYFYHQASSFGFSYVNFGGVDGSFIGAGKGFNNGPEIAEISPNNLSLLRSYGVNKNGDRLKLQETVKNSQTNNRPWYQDAVKAGKPIWSRIYTWADFPDQISISASAPVYDDRRNLLGVLGIDLELCEISRFLRPLSQRQSGDIFIMDRSGLMIASSDLKKLAPLVDGKAQQKSALQSSNPVIREVTQTLIEKYGSLKAISANKIAVVQRITITQGSPVFVKVHPFQDAYGLDWLVVTAIPESHFFEEINNNLQRTIVLCGLTLLIAIGLGLLTTRWITRPIERLTQASEALAQGEWHDSLAENSSIDELQRLAIAFNKMAAQIQESFKTVLQELEDSRAMYQKMVQTQTDFILRSQPDTTILFANEALCRAVGKSLDEVIGHKWVDFADAQDIETIIEQLVLLTVDNSCFTVEVRDQRVGNKRGWTQWINQGIFDEQGQLIEIQSVGRDITELKEIESKLRESQRFIERIAEATPSLLYIYDHLEERNIYANRSVAEILGYSRAEIQAMGADLFQTICHPDDLPKLFDAVQRIRNLDNDQEVIEIEYRVIDAQGQWHWLLSRDLVFLRTEDGRVWQTLGNAQDISDRKKAEIELQKLQNYLNSIIENLPDMVFVKDAKTLTFVSLNRAGEQLLGYQRDQLIGKSDRDFFLPEEAEFFIDKDREVLANKSILDIPQEAIQTRHQGTRILHTKKIPILDEFNEPLYLLGISEDITQLLESENRLTQIARHIPGVIYQFRMRVDGTFHFPYASEGIREIYGVTPQDVIEDANPVLSVLHPDDLERVYQSILYSAEYLTPWHLEYRVCLPDGRVIWVVGDSTPTRQFDGSTIWHGYIKDISDRKQVEMALRESESKFSTIFQSSPDPIIISSFEDSILMDVNNSFCEFIEREKRDVLGISCMVIGLWKNLSDLVHLKEQLMQQNYVKNIEAVLRSASGEEKTVLIAAARANLGGQDCIISLFKDISARKRSESMLILAKERAERAENKLKRTQVHLQNANKKLIKLINIDPLTKIANRRCFNDRLQQEWRRLHREQKPFSLLIFDVDYFKKYNDGYGHPQGDLCLIQIAQAAQKVLGRSTDLVARIGGEEFAVILPNTNLEGAKAIAEKLRLTIKALNIPHAKSKVSDRVTISLGITSQIPTEDILPTTLIAQADQALYLAKEWGRNQFVIFTGKTDTL